LALGRWGIERGREKRIMMIVSCRNRGCLGLRVNQYVGRRLFRLDEQIERRSTI
jgi:hypothetical protein